MAFDAIDLAILMIDAFLLRIVTIFVFVSLACFETGPDLAHPGSASWLFHKKYREGLADERRPAPMVKSET